MAKYHLANQVGYALCGTRGNKKGFHVVCLSTPEWYAMENKSHQCSKCVKRLEQKRRAL